MNFFNCYKCNHVWFDNDDHYTDDDCGKCGASHNSARQSPLSLGEFENIMSAITNDESSSDEELCKFFKESFKLNDSQVKKIISKRGFFLSTLPQRESESLLVLIEILGA